MVILAIIGDSLTAAWGETRFTELDHLHMRAFGVGSQVSTQIVDRIPDALGCNPEYVAIMAGTNDIAENNGPYNEDSVIDTLTRGIQMIRSGNSKPIICTIPPSNYFNWNPAIDPKEKIAHLNTRIRNLAKQENILLADFYPILQDKTSGIEPIYTTDGTHLTDLAYVRMEVLFQAILQKRSLSFGREYKNELDRVEMIGDNCELGNTLVKNGYNGGSLFRFVYNLPNSMLSALEDNLDNIFNLDNLSALPWGMALDSAYGMHFHSETVKKAEDGSFFIDKEDKDTKEKYKNEKNKVEYLKNKFFMRAKSGKTVYVIKCNSSIQPELLDGIERELKRISEGSPFILLEVRQSNHDFPLKKVERLSSHRAVGWVRQFADYSTATTIPDMEGWISVIKEVLAMPMVLSSQSHRHQA